MYNKNSQLGILSGAFGMSYGNIDKKVYGSDRGSNELFYNINDNMVKEIRNINNVRSIEPCFNIGGAFLISSADVVTKEYLEELHRIEYNSEKEFPLYIRGYNDKMLEERNKFIDKGENIINKGDTGYINCIFVNNSYSKINHSFNTNVIKDLKINDVIEIKTPYKANNKIEYKKVKLHVSAIMNQEYSASQDGNRGAIRGAQIIIREDDYKKLIGQYEYNTLYIKATDNKLSKLDDELSSITEKYSFTAIGGKGEEDKFISNEQEFYNNISIIYQIIILFILLIQGVVITRSNIIIRQFEITILKNLGMSYKNIKKLFILESEFYCIVSGILSSIIACIIHNIGIMNINKILKLAGYNKFISYEIPIFYILVILLVFIVIGYISVVASKSKLKN